jgi:type I restriction enzyme S subunit
MNLTAQSLKDEFLGRACLKTDDAPALLNQRITRFQVGCAFDARQYLLFYFRSRFFRAFVNGLDTGSLIRHMHSKDVARHVVPLPPPREQAEIARRVGSLLPVVDVLQERWRKATVAVEGQTQAILAKAFRGELVPTEADLARVESRPYEPANIS